MSLLLLPLVAVLGALGRRIAGGALNQWCRCGPGQRVMGDLPARLLFGVAIQTSAFLGGADWHQSLLLIPGVWLGWTICGLQGRPDFPTGLRGGSEVAEALWGACMGAAAFLAAYGG